MNNAEKPKSEIGPEQRAAIKKQFLQELEAEGSRARTISWFYLGISLAMIALIIFSFSKYADAPGRTWNLWIPIAAGVLTLFGGLSIKQKLRMEQKLVATLKKASDEEFNEVIENFLTESLSRGKAKAE